MDSIFGVPVSGPILTTFEYRFCFPLCDLDSLLAIVNTYILSSLNFLLPLAPRTHSLFFSIRSLGTPSMAVI